MTLGHYSLFSQISIFFDVSNVMKHNGLSQLRNDYPLLAGLKHDLAGVTWIVGTNNYEREVDDRKWKAEFEAY